MRAQFENLLGRAKPVHPHEWLWAPLAEDPTFVLRPMFGGKSVYLGGRLVLYFAAREEPWRGVLVGTERVHHESLRAEFPNLTPHPILPKWLYLPEGDDAFERVAARLVALARQRDPRLGVVPGRKKKRIAAPETSRQVGKVSAKAVHFDSAVQFRRWLEKHHATTRELLVGFYKKDSGRGGITYAQALDEALCFGWIDGIRKCVDAEAYTIRFTPRKPGSIWSRINIGHVKRLGIAGRMRSAGQAAFAARVARKSGVYSFEQRPQNLPPGLERHLRKSRKAWAHWQEQPPGYRRTAIWWVISAKQEATRRRRLDRLIALSAAGRRLSL